MLIQTFTGHETFRTGSTRIISWYRKNAGTKEMPLDAAVADLHSGIERRGFPEVVPAGRTAYNGQWAMGRYNVVPGSFLHMSVVRNQNSLNFGYSAVFMLREEAALLRVGIPLIQHEWATVTQGYIEGNMDIIPPQWLHRLGLKDIPEKYFDKYGYEACNELNISMTVLEREKSEFAPPEIVRVVNRGGVERTITKETPQRKMLFLRKGPRA